MVVAIQPTHDPKDGFARWYEGLIVFPKPNRPYELSQLENYDRAFALDEQWFNTPVRRFTVDNRIYVVQDDWIRLCDRIGQMDLRAHQQLLARRIKDVNAFMSYTPAFPITRAGFERAFELCDTAVAHFHYRWNVARAVDNIVEAALAPLPVELRLEAMKLVTDRPPLETMESGNSLARIVAMVQQNPAYRQALMTFNGSIESLRNLPELYGAFKDHGHNYMLKHDENWSLPIQYDVICEQVIENLDQEFYIDSPPVADQAELEARIQPYVADIQEFKEIITLGVQQGIQKENEHHYQVRAQYPLCEHFNLAAIKIGSSTGKEVNPRKMGKDEFLDLLGGIP